MSSHDNAYKQIFSHPEMVQDLLQGFVREDWIEQLDFNSLEKVSGSYVSDDLRDREDDIIWRGRWGQAGMAICLSIAGIPVDGRSLHGGQDADLRRATLSRPG